MSLGYFELYFTSIESRSVESSLYRAALPQSIQLFGEWFARQLKDLVRRWVDSHQSQLSQWSEWHEFSQLAGEDDESFSP